MTKKSNLDIISAAWILASNDENCLITYESIKHRLGLDKDFDVKTLIKLHGELFRQNAPPKSLEIWKGQMQKDQHLPSWIKGIGDKTERENKINEIGVTDIFRSQFRPKYGTPASDISIINWGLEHIDRIRKSSLEERQEKSKIASTLWIPVLSLIISLSAVISSYFIQKQNIDNQNSLKKIELEYNTKQEGYTNFMKSVIASYSLCGQNKIGELKKSLDNIETSYYNIEHLLLQDDKVNIWLEYQMFTKFCLNNTLPNLSDSSFADSCVRYKTYFRENLQSSLFDN